jgi:hypothetical protein
MGCAQRHCSLVIDFACSGDVLGSSAGLGLLQFGNVGRLRSSISGAALVNAGPTCHTEGASVA